MRHGRKHYADREATAASMDTRAIELKMTVVADSGEVSALLRDTLLAEHVHLVRHIAHRLFRRRTYVDIDDLIKVGMIGLEEAIRRHKHHTAKGFEAYASTFIRAAMLEFVRKANWSPASP
jgi:DNA-directed RNA polymerase specialized sigma subunit